MNVWLLKSAGAHSNVFGEWQPGPRMKLRQWPAERVDKKKHSSLHQDDPIKLINIQLKSCVILPKFYWTTSTKQVETLPGINSLSKWASRLDHMWEEPKMTRTDTDWNEVQTRKKSNVGTNPCKWSVVESPWLMKHDEPYCWIWNTAHLFLHLSRMQCAQPGVIHSFATCQIHYSSDGVWAVVWQYIVMYIYMHSGTLLLRHTVLALPFSSAITVPFDKGIQSHTRIPNPG